MSCIYAIIPARSGSKGIKDKNIKKICGIELLGYSIRFAQRLHVDRIICSTDSEQYADIARSFGADVPFLRSHQASSDTAMEEDILRDLYDKFDDHSVSYPDYFVWLRPTFIFRDVTSVKKCIHMLENDAELTASRTVAEAEPRLYTGSDTMLFPNFDDHGRSMIRRQEIRKAFKVFSTDVFRGHIRNSSSSFLGNRVGYIEIPKICGMDIDDEIDFSLVELLITYRRDMVNAYL